MHYCNKCSLLIPITSVFENHYEYCEGPLDKQPDYDPTAQYDSEDEEGAMMHETIWSMAHSCGLCQETFETLEAHYTAVHQRCKPGCNDVFRSAQALHHHRVTLLSHALLYCQECRMLFANKDDLRAHKKTDAHHALVAAVVPRTVNPRSLAEGLAHVNEDFRVTTATWNGCAYECYICHKAYKTVDSLNSHVTSVKHSFSRRFIRKCPHGPCGLSFPTLPRLWDHIEQGLCGIGKFMFSGAKEKRQRNPAKTAKARSQKRRQEPEPILEGGEPTRRSSRIRSLKYRKQGNDPKLASNPCLAGEPFSLVPSLEKQTGTQPAVKPYFWMSHLIPPKPPWSSTPSSLVQGVGTGATQGIFSFTRQASSGAVAPISSVFAIPTAPPTNSTTQSAFSTQYGSAMQIDDASFTPLESKDSWKQSWASASSNLFQGAGTSSSVFSFTRKDPGSSAPPITTSVFAIANVGQSNASSQTIYSTQSHPVVITTTSVSSYNGTADSQNQTWASSSSVFQGSPTGQSVFSFTRKGGGAFNAPPIAPTNVFMAQSVFQIQSPPVKK